MNLGLFAGSPFFAAHKDRLLPTASSFVGAEHCFATPFPDGTWLGVEKNIDANATGSPHSARSMPNAGAP